MSDLSSTSLPSDPVSIDPVSSDPVSPQLRELGSWVEALALDAGALALEFYARRDDLALEVKTSLSDVATIADREVEALIRTRIAEAFPEDAFLGEEGGGATSLGTSARRWVVDPIDGTTNFRFGFGSFAVSIAVEDGEGALAAAVYDPTRRECTTAVRGGGAFCNGVPVHVRRPTHLREVLVDTSIGRGPARERFPALLTDLLTACCDVRRGGSAAAALASIACGRLDGYWGGGLQPWDIAAGVLLVTEAGGRVAGLDGALPGPWGCLAAPPGVFDALADLIRPHVPDPA